MPQRRKPVCTPADVFWAEVSPCDHVLQLYADDAALLDTLEGFVSAGLSAGEAVIVVATEAHRAGLAARLGAKGIDVEGAIAAKRYFPRDAEETLDLFMRNGWPEDALFASAVYPLLQEVRSQGCKVRAFGEMVALLWSRGLAGATLRLEQLWDEVIQQERIPVLCAYPRAGFHHDAIDSFRRICAAHSRRVPA
ncbi:MAG TPA: MEDS domain-containing protein [Opitutaceae bacterium]|nr:MEDS domain-containing protein [Opitutaceae bacterium]